MILIIGGRAQGKLEFAGTLCGAQTREKEVAADGECDPVEAAFSSPYLCHLEQYVRRLLEEGADPMVFLDRLMRENPCAVVIMDEIGYGIVPADALLREYRETVGRVGQRLAAFSDSVYRVVCGIGTKIK